MNSLLEDDSSLNEPLMSREHAKKKIKIMKTPCDHYYHVYCLTTWMNRKLECPKCRKNLPPLEI